MKKYSGIYAITSPSGRVYVGQSWEINERFSGYRRKEHPAQRVLFRSFNKYGIDAHVFEIIHTVIEENTSQAEMNRLEQFYMDEYRARGIGLMNCREAGANGRLSEESKRLMSESLKGHIPWNKGKKGLFKHSEEAKRSMSARMKGKPPHNKGKARSASAIARTRDGNKGKKRTEEQRERIAAKMRNRSSEEWAVIGRKISESKKGKVPNWSPEGKARTIESLKRRGSPMQGKKHSAESKRLIGLKSKGHPPNSGCFKKGIPSPKSEDWKRKVSLALTGKPLSDEAKAKLRDANLGKRHSEESKRKMSEAHRARFQRKAVAA